MSSFLQSLDPVEMRLAEDAITSAIQHSFGSNPCRETFAETKDRFNKCVKLVSAMRKEVGWSWSRIKDKLGEALETELNGATWVPPSRNSWLTDESTGLILPPGLK